MRKFLVSLVATTLMRIGATPAALAASGPFKGSYGALDVDGSRVTVSFAGTGETRVVTYVDERVTCLGGASMTLSAVGTISGESISGSFGEVCGGEFNFLFTADPSTQTVSDGTITYRRGDQGPDAFSGVWIAVDLDGSSLKLTLEGTGLDRDVSSFDDGASVCGPVIDGEGINWAGDGVGIIGSTPGFGRFIDVDLSGGCAGSQPEPIGTQTFEYDYVNNQLIGPLGDFSVIWSRK
jgi:hypothetical protein